MCCVDKCVNPLNDPFNCGNCGNKCTGLNSYCNNGACATPPCTVGTLCVGATCCGSSCCQSGQLCCDEETGGATKGGPVCYTPTAAQPTCPMGCAPLCQ